MGVLELCIAFAIGFFLGEWILAKRIRDVIVAETSKEVEDAIEVFKLKTTASDDSILLYDDQDAFICQGKTLEELAFRCKQHSNIHVASVLHGNKIVIFMDGKVKETK
jgi:hypothetical protein